MTLLHQEKKQLTTSIERASSQQATKEEGLKEGMEKQKKEAVIKSFRLGLSAEIIVGITDLPLERVHEILREEGAL